MAWPPSDFLRYKMLEHSAWYSGDANILSSFYSQSAELTLAGTKSVTKNLFWNRQHKDETCIAMRVPIAGDIASTSADILFGESPTVKIAEAHSTKATQSMKDTQIAVDTMLVDSGFFRKIVEAAETCSAIGGVYIKLAWDKELSPYPIPVVEQAENAYPEFKFGMLRSVSFVSILATEKGGSTVVRLVEIYSSDGSIRYEFYKGRADNLGEKIDLDDTEYGAEYQDITTGIKELLCVYVPNILPNRHNRNSYIGRSDFAGIEGLMHGLDETYSSWMRDLILARGKVLVPEEYLRKSRDGAFKFDLDTMIYDTMDVDPTVAGNQITSIQFEIRAEQFAKTSMELIERIVMSSGYSPQSFGINIEGSATSGVALNIRERKSFSTKSKKEQYWEPALKKLVKLSMLIYKQQLSGKLDDSGTVTIQFADGSGTSLSEMASAVAQISNAIAASVDTKVRYLHPEWSEEQISIEVELIIKENGLSPELPDPEEFLDPNLEEK